MTGGPAGPILDWLVRREPAPPAALADRIATALGALPPDAMHSGAVGAARISETCLVAAELLLAHVIEEGGTSRAAALDLLAADALVTYAFEAAADDPASLPSAARAAMTRLSRVAAGASPAP